MVVVAVPPVQHQLLLQHLIMVEHLIMELQPLGVVVVVPAQHGVIQEIQEIQEAADHQEIRVIQVVALMVDIQEVVADPEDQEVLVIQVLWGILVQVQHLVVQVVLRLQHQLQILQLL
jgi:hypothetical protein